jgi:hypothetical protein
MKMGVHLEELSVFIVAWVLLLGPLAVWPFVWRKLILVNDPIHGRKISTVLILAVVGNASYAFLWSCILFRPLLGADYSDRRTITIVVNGTILIAAGIITAFQRQHPRAYLVVAFGLTTLSWLYVLVIGAVV